MNGHNNSLPQNPGLSNGVPQGHSNAPNGFQNIGALAAHALTSTLTNPYHSLQSYTNPNYHAYFAQTWYSGNAQQGNAVPSTFNPQALGPQVHPTYQRQHPLYPKHSVKNRTSQEIRGNLRPPSGNTHCTYGGCSFTGSAKTVEIHMMDRHLIFPPGWRKPKPDWDADPSLKGKPVPIPGTGVLLNTPEAIDTWIAERKKRWPTNQRIEDKKRKAQEALSRGEIDPNELTAKTRKRRRMDGESLGYEHRKRGRGRAGVIRQQSREVNRFDSEQGKGGTCPAIQPQAGAETYAIHDDDKTKHISSALDSYDSGSDIDPSKDAVSSKIPNQESVYCDRRGESSASSPQTNNRRKYPADNHVASRRSQVNQRTQPMRRRQLAQPKASPQNPFANRPSFLRSLLLPEIRCTISNISQAIHFLVENDFLQGVELNPGDSDSQPIKVLR